MTTGNYKAGTFRKEHGYRSFCPNPINREWKVASPEVNTLLEEANLRLGELNAFSAFVPDVDVFIRMHIVKEATQSSRIEGTRTKMGEAVMGEKDISPEQRDDWQEVQNYIDAMSWSIERLEGFPLSSRLIRDAHRMLLKGVRGKNKLPGEFRASQNWIGGGTIQDAAFVPPHHTLVSEAMADLEKFLNNGDIQVPRLLRIGMAHYQFETIHPFLDGNGRVGRLLITLYLIDQKMLRRPTLYLSDFIEKNRQHYYNNLMAVSLHGKMEQWLKFFLAGVIETANRAIDTFTKIIALRDKLEKETIVSLGKRLPNARALLAYLYSKPVVTVADVTAQLDVTKPTANSLVKDFAQLGILTERTGYKRNRMFVFEEYMKLFDS